MKSVYCDLSSQRVHYLESGKGKIIILLPGLWITSRSFENLGEQLSNYYRVIIPDLYKGKSTFTICARSLKDYSYLLKDLLNALKIKKYYLIGISASGLIASYFVEHVPDKPEKLLLFSSSFSPPSINCRFCVILKGYIQLLIRNFLSFKGIKVNLLWIIDSFFNFIRHPTQFIREALIPAIEIHTAATVKTTLYIAKFDEFFSYKKVIKENSSIMNLQPIVLEENHAWFFMKPEKFVEKVRDFFD